MGLNYLATETPQQCFNPSKTVKVGWFAECVVTVTGWSVPRWRELIGASEYVPASCVPATQAVVVRVVTGGTHNLFVGFNRATGANVGTKDARNKVVVVLDKDASLTPSELVAKLAVGEQFSYNASTAPLVIKFCAVVNGRARTAVGPDDGRNVCA